jgi:chromate transporter
MAPIVIALFFATACLMVQAPDTARNQWIVYLVASIGTVVVWRTRTHTLWLMAAGALIGVTWLT